MSLAGFDFRALNAKYLRQPANDAANYGVNILSAPNVLAWRCIGVYHLKPSENRGRHNIFIECLDAQGQRTVEPEIGWTWWIDAPPQILKLTKPADEPAADIPIETRSTITIHVNGGLSDSVGNLHARHTDEGEGNTYGHHSFYVVFQRQGNSPILVEPPTEPLTLEQRVAELERRVNAMEGD